MRNHITDWNQISSTDKTKCMKRTLGELPAQDVYLQNTKRTYVHTVFIRYKLRRRPTMIFFNVFYIFLYKPEFSMFLTLFQNQVFIIRSGYPSLFPFLPGIHCTMQSFTRQGIRRSVAWEKDAPLLRNRRGKSLDLQGFPGAKIRQAILYLYPWKWRPTA